MKSQMLVLVGTIAIGFSACGGNGGVTGPDPVVVTPPPIVAPPPPPPPPPPTNPTPTPPPSSTMSMRFTLTDACNDGRGLQARFFDDTNFLQWPADSSRVYVAAAGQSIDVTLAVRPDAYVCFGARTDPPTSTYWGVGIDGNEGCDNCCYRAGNFTVSRNLICQ